MTIFNISLFVLVFIIFIVGILKISTNIELLDKIHGFDDETQNKNVK